MYIIKNVLLEFELWYISRINGEIHIIVTQVQASFNMAVVKPGDPGVYQLHVFISIKRRNIKFEMLVPGKSRRGFNISRVIFIQYKCKCGW